MHAQSLGRGGARHRRVFPRAARDRAHATTRSPSTPTPRSSSRRRPCSSATRWRPTIRCSSRSRCGRRTFDAWGELKRGLALHAGDRRIALQPLRVPAPAAGARGRHHPARHLRRRRHRRRCARSRARRGALRLDRAAQPDGAAGDGRERALLRGGAATSAFLEYRLPHGPGYVFGTGSRGADHRRDACRAPGT